MTASLLAVSDLHISYRENREVVDAIRPDSPDDWLIVAGDVGERFDGIAWALRLLRERFATVIWAPGNHELWTHPGDPVQLRGEQRYRALVELCRELGVLTPEDEYPTWPGRSGPVVVAPLFLLYEMLLFPDPYPDRGSWCAARLAETEKRLAAIDPACPSVLAGHWPLRREPTDVMWHPEFAQWCGTDRTADWHLRFRATAAVYGHLHIPRTTWYDGVRFEEVSLGYPREWTRRGGPPRPVRRILDGDA